MAKCLINDLSAEACSTASSVIDWIGPTAHLRSQKQQCLYEFQAMNNKGTTLVAEVLKVHERIEAAQEWGALQDHIARLEKRQQELWTSVLFYREQTQKAEDQWRRLMKDEDSDEDDELDSTGGKKVSQLWFMLGKDIRPVPLDSTRKLRLYGEAPSLQSEFRLKDFSRICLNGRWESGSSMKWSRVSYNGSGLSGDWPIAVELESHSIGAKLKRLVGSWWEACHSLDIDSC